MKKIPKVALSARIPEDIKAALEKESVRTDRSVSYILTKVLLAYYADAGSIYWTTPTNSKLV